jgi:hypothetical protein
VEFATLSVLQQTKRAFVIVLLSVASTYSVAVSVNRDSEDQELLLSDLLFACPHIESMNSLQVEKARIPQNMCGDMQHMTDDSNISAWDPN